MFCYSFVGHDERTLGVLSLVFRYPSTLHLSRHSRHPTTVTRSPLTMSA